ncbi:FRG domain-containing protein [Promicromonospora soli]
MPRTVGAMWKAAGYHVVPASSPTVMATLGAVGVYDTGQRFAWRGMSSIDYALESSLQRSLRKQDKPTDEVAVRAAEKKILGDARRWGLGVTRHGNIDDLQLLADLQHYGVPTRLVDFTSNPMTALWFACQSPGAAGVSKSGVVLALNITRWSEHSSGLGAGTWGSIGDPSGYVLQEAIAQGDPFIVRAVEPNVRLTAQEGYFVSGAVPTSDAEGSPFKSFTVDFEPRTGAPLDLTAPRTQGAPPKQLPFVAVQINSGLKKSLLRYLEGSYSRTARTLFPDFPGFREFGTATGSGEPSAAVEGVDGADGG